MKFQIFDLSHLLESGMLLFPGTPAIRLHATNTIEKSGFAETQLTFTSHVGTHVDAPAHLLKSGQHLNDYPAEHLWGRAFIVDCRTCSREISLAHLKSQAVDYRALDFLLLATGYADKWPASVYLKDFPVLTSEAAQWVSQFSLKAVGIDAISFDPIDSVTFPNHHCLLGRAFWLIENLVIPPALLGKPAELVIAPLKYAGADGAPVRVLARIISE